MEPYYADDLVTLFLGDCRVVTEWLAADVLVTDPPYGRAWRQGRPGISKDEHAGIAGDGDTALRDWALAAWGGRLAICFGDLMLAPPTDNKQTMVYAKAQDSGCRGATAGFRRDAEAIYLIGPWPAGIEFSGASSILRTSARMISGNIGMAARYGHPHAKPVDVMETLISACPPGIIADPFAGSGSTLVAARNLGRRAVGVELDERYCERAARRLSQMTLCEMA